MNKWACTVYFVDFRRWHAAGHEALDRGQQFLAAAIVESERQDQAVVPSRPLDRREHGGLKLRVQSFQATDVPQLCPLPVEFIDFALDHACQDAGEFRRSPPGGDASCLSRKPKA